MTAIKMKVGPKGQVVIPKQLRDENKIHEGDEVLFDSSRIGIIIRKPEIDAVANFERIAKKGKSTSKIDSNKDHGYMLEERWKRANEK